MQTILEIPDKKFPVGSILFFNGIEGFFPKDNDYVILIDNPTIFNDEMVMRNGIEDIFLWRRMDADEFADVTIKLDDPILAGKFLSNEFNKEIGFTIGHLKRLKPLFDKIDKKHEYEKEIFNYYIENNAFSLTSKQLKSVYQTYKKNHNTKTIENASK